MESERGGDPGATSAEGASIPYRGRRRLAAVVALLVTVAVVGIAMGNFTRGSTPSQGRAVSTDPKAFVLPALHGEGTVALADYRGHPVVVNFFASWCSSCRGELPIMAKVASDLRGQVTFIGVNTRENGDGYAMAQQYGIGSWPLARDSGGVQDSGLHDALKADGMPVTAFYSAEGTLLGVSYSALSERALRAELFKDDGIPV